MPQFNRYRRKPDADQYEAKDSLLEAVKSTDEATTLHYFKLLIECCGFRKIEKR